MNENTWDGRGWTALAMERYLTMVYRLAHARTGSVQDAEDVAQDVMLRLSRHERSIRKRGAPEGVADSRHGEPCEQPVSQRVAAKDASAGGRGADGEA